MVGLGLVGDVIDLVPFVTGIGESIKALKALNKLSDGFKALSNATEYGIKTYRELRKAIKGLDLQVHHIIEVRFLKALGKNVDDAWSVAVTAAEHQRFTNAWRKMFPYGIDYSKLSLNDLWEAAQDVYADYPELIAAAWDTLFG